MKQLQNETEWTKLAEVELLYKNTVKAAERPSIKTASDCYQLLINTWDLNGIEVYEEFKVLLLNRANRVTGLYQLSKGGICGTVADPRLVLAVALKSLSVGLVLAHNHLSGNLTPSIADRELTTKMKVAASYHDITILDHLVISNDSYYSFAENGLL